MRICVLQLSASVLRFDDELVSRLILYIFPKNGKLLRRGRRHRAKDLILACTTDDLKIDRLYRLRNRIEQKTVTTDDEQKLRKAVVVDYDNEYNVFSKFESVVDLFGSINTNRFDTLYYVRSCEPHDQR